MKNKFRHSNVTHTSNNAKDIHALKAISQNMMHANLSITDGVYGKLLDNDVREQISMIGKVAHAKSDEDEIYAVMERLLAQRKINKG